MLTHFQVLRLIPAALCSSHLFGQVGDLLLFLINLILLFCLQMALTYILTFTLGSLGVSNTLATHWQLTVYYIALFMNHSLQLLLEFQPTNALKYVAKMNFKEECSI